MSAWPYALRLIGAEGLYFHHLRHRGNHVRAGERRGSSVGADRSRRQALGAGTLTALR